MIAVSNITSAGAKRRLVGAAGMLALALTGAWMMLGADMDRTWRVAYFPTFWLVGLGLFQVYEKT